MHQLFNQAVLLKTLKTPKHNTDSNQMVSVALCPIAYVTRHLTGQESVRANS